MNQMLSSLSSSKWIAPQVRQACSFYIKRLRLLPAFWLALLWRISLL